MLFYEVKKVFSRVVNKVVLALLVIVLLFASIMAIRDHPWVNGTGESEYGIRAVQKLANAQHEWAGLLTEQRIAEVIQENARIGNTPEAQSEDIQQQNIAYGWKQGIADIRDVMNSSFCAFQEYDYYKADTLTAADAADFYSNRTAHLTEWLSKEENTDRYSDAEKQFLLEQYEKMETPLKYDFVESWDSFFQWAVTIQMFLAMLLGFLVSGIFSGETQNRADAVFFAAQYGRSKGVRAKVLAGFGIVTVLYWVVFLLYTLFVLGCTGFIGADCMIQILHWKSFYNITIWQDYLLVAFGGYIGCLFLSSVTMLVSAKTKSNVLAALVPFVSIFIPNFLANVVNDTVIDKIVALLPDQLLQLDFVLNRFSMYSIGGTIVGAVGILFVLYTILTLLLQPILYAVFRKQEIQ
ncbi:ABC transporter permease [Butyricicoccus sp.]|uniref:ABC transporter permease n=1 Tax=Butyricicoccus sp. TaxID=2049021 RepID=UPI003F162098